MTAPDRIWATTSISMGWKAGYCTNELDDVRYENVHEFIRADLHVALQAENERLRQQVDTMRQQIFTEAALVSKYAVLGEFACRGNRAKKIEDAVLSRAALK